jgi:hypothetical protein
MNETLKTITKLILILVIGIHLGPLLVWIFGLAGYLSVGGSYIGNINTPSYSSTESILKDLNNRGSGEVVKFSGFRPIFIFEQDLNKRDRSRTLESGEESGYDILGMAWSLPMYCLILMHDNLEEKLYRTTLIHEYLHCFNYGHSDDVSDIMYSSNHPRLRDDSIDKYLKELKELYE